MKSKFVSLIIFTGFIISTLVLGNSQPLVYPNQVNQDAIVIDGNADFLSQASTNSWQGTGTIVDPIIIKNYKIEASGNLIKITNTNLQFRIQDSILSTGTIGILLQNVSYATITNNTFQNNGGNAISLIKNSENIHIEHNLIENNGEHGINVEDSSFITVSSNTFHNIGLQAIFVTGDQAHYNQILNNIVDITGINGIGIGFGASNNNFANNVIMNAGLNGVVLGSDTENNTIINNSILTSGKDGIIVLDDAYNNSISENTIQGSTGHGIRFNTISTNNFVVDNFLINNSGSGLSIQSADEIIIAGNVIANNMANGLTFVGSEKNTIANNTIFGNTEYGLFMGSTTTNNLVTKNDFLANNVAGTSQAYDDGTDNQFNQNYWYEWSEPDENADGIVDNEFFFDGDTGNSDLEPQSEPNNQITFDFVPSDMLSTSLPINQASGLTFILGILGLGLLVTIKKVRPKNKF